MIKISERFITFKNIRNRDANLNANFPENFVHHFEP
jgi:hypothetical protein